MDFASLPYAEVRTLHKDIGALLDRRRAEAIDSLRDQAEDLGVELKEIVPKKKRGRPRRADDDA